MTQGNKMHLLAITLSMQSSAAELFSLSFLDSGIITTSCKATSSLSSANQPPVHCKLECQCPLKMEKRTKKRQLMRVAKGFARICCCLDLAGGKDGGDS